MGTQAAVVKGLQQTELTKEVLTVTKAVISVVSYVHHSKISFDPQKKHENTPSLL